MKVPMEIHLGHSPADARIKVGGEDVTALVTAIRVESRGHKLTRVVLESNKSSLTTLEGVVEAHVVPDTDVHDDQPNEHQTNALVMVDQLVDYLRTELRKSVLRGQMPSYTADGHVRVVEDSYPWVKKELTGAQTITFEIPAPLGGSSGTD